MFTGPGFLMSIAYLDPGNLEADLQAGASGRYTLLWVLFWATIMGLFLQNLASKLGVVSGKHLAQHCREYPKPARYALFVMTEIALICVDCQEVVGSAIAIHILSSHKVPIWAGCIITAIDCFFFMLLDQAGIRKLEALFGVFITTMVMMFGWQYFAQLPPQGELFRGWWEPRVVATSYGDVQVAEADDNFQQAAGLIGAVIMPHNIFLHSALVLSRRVDRDWKMEPERAHYRVSEAIYYNRIESSVALLVSFVINLFVVGVFANLNYFQSSGLPQCTYDGSYVGPTDGSNADGESWDGIGLVTAGDCLKSVYGHSWWLYIWALGVLAAGQASTITGTYAGQFIMCGFVGLQMKPWVATTFARTFSLIPALVIAIITPSEPQNMDKLNQWLNIAQAIQLPFAMLPVMYFSYSAHPNHCRHEYVTKGWSAWLCWLIAALVLVDNMYAIYVTAWLLPNHIYVWIIFAIFCIFYGAFVIYLLLTCAGLITLGGQMIAKVVGQDENEGLVGGRAIADRPIEL